MPLSVIIQLSQAQIEEVLREHIRREGFEPSKMKFKVSTHEGGDQRDSYPVTTFDGVDVEAIKKP